ncbi:hypothetical protein D6783_01795 [Candidatus Woesearchaeota archaeon]|nr:MAG: hypothetical protein D6783_01795 [Candidatus Woesearchaeota archaeon]
MLVLLASAPFLLSFTAGPNYRNVSVDAIVNVTQSLPEVLSVLINDGSGNITLNAGTTTLITCNATIRDYNGGGTLANVTATFYDNNTASEGSPDDNNNHYSNTSCTQVNVNGYYANYTCTFNVYYYANNATWVCNVTATDTYDFNGSDSGSNYNTTAINPVLALNVTSPIDYGDLAVGDTSGAIEANVTNFGNRDINVTVYGYGATPGDGLAMVCQVGNITIANERYSLNSADTWAAMTPLASTPAYIANLTLPQQTNDTQAVINSTYWRLYVPPNPFGQCNGTVVFQAEEANP